MVLAPGGVEEGRQDCTAEKQVACLLALKVGAILIQYGSWLLVRPAEGSSGECAL